MYPQVRIVRREKNGGIGFCLTECIRQARGEYIIFLCQDDLFSDSRVIGDMVEKFENKELGYIGRLYYQFMDGYEGAVRVHRTNNPFLQADNPSGLGFRTSALKDIQASNRMFIESASLVKAVLDAGWEWDYLPWDTVAVRIHPHGNTATKRWYYTSSPILSWYSLLGKQDFFLSNYLSLIQLKNWVSYEALLNEMRIFISLRPSTLFRIDFWALAFISLITPRWALRRFTNWYKNKISRYMVSIKSRP